ncbi:MAG: hypothetical protein Q606_CBAC00026G0001 [Intestinibacter bartlettii DORA_8_9]|uniref:Uncharacterized protein n=1 Tax=Intestinibacter bartlettii TaxID=261299 RepID=A0A6N2ZWD1_9FIRM|nr:MAG: hypothetical protein Q606_CBAC00026G0001 [Intestinibacter bartlettii DORA_8_9]
MLYKEEISNYLTYAEYDKIIEIYKKIGREKLANVLGIIAFDDEDISAYFFMLYMVKYDEKNREFWMSKAATIINTAFCWIEGAASIDFFLRKQLLKEEYSVDNLLVLTNFNGMPDFLLSDEECIKIAKEVLKLDPNNERAKEILEEFNIE